VKRVHLIGFFVAMTAAAAFAGLQKDITHVWSQRFGGEQMDMLRDLCIDGAGHVIACGHFEGDIDFGGGVLSSAGNEDVFLAEFDADGQHLWSRRFGDADSQQGVAVGVDDAGDIYLLGWMRGTVNFGGLDLTGPGNEDVFLAKFDTDGGHLWSQVYGGTDNDRPEGLAVTSYGDVAITGFIHSGTTNICGVSGTTLGRDAFVAVFDTDGPCQWGQAYGTTGDQQGRSVAWDPVGFVLLAGEFRDTIDLGWGPMTSAGQTDVFLAKFTSAGQLYFTSAYGDADHDAVASVDVVDGDIYLGGSTIESIDFGGGALDGGSGWDIYVACLRHDGTHLWSTLFPDGDGSYMYDLCSVAPGWVGITGLYSGDIDFGGGQLVSAGSEDIFVAVLDAGDGGHLESASYGGTGQDVGDALAIAAGDVMVLGGYSSDMLSLGGDPLPGAGSYDVLLARNLIGMPGLPPEVVSPIPDLVVQETAPPVDDHVRLTDVFRDPEDGSALTYTVVGLTDEDLLTVTVDADSCLDLSFDELRDGAAEVTVRATDSVGRSVEDVFEVTVVPLPDEPSIQSIVDVSNDQGRAVRIALRRSGQDDLDATTPILQYEAWRRIDPLPLKAAGRPVPPVAGVPVSDPGKSYEDWEFAGAFPAHGHSTYNLIVPTLADSTISDGQHWSVFFVRAATDAPLLYFDSSPDSGYSVDNLAPNAPEGFAAAYGANVALSWEPGVDEDFRHFKIYRGDAPGFEIDPAHPVHMTVDTTWLDGAGGFDSVYRISAVDFAGNESPAVAPVATTGAETAPSAVRLLAARPNPFNPRTAIRFELPAATTVVLRIHDVQGRVVRTLAAGESFAAGRHELAWDGTDETGRALASGAYVLRLAAGSVVRSERLMLLR